MVVSSLALPADEGESLIVTVTDAGARLPPIRLDKVIVKTSDLS